MMNERITDFPELNIFCAKCGTKLEMYTEVQECELNFNIYSGNREYCYYVQAKCPSWRRFHWHTKGQMRLGRNLGGFLEWEPDYFNGSW